MARRPQRRKTKRTKVKRAKPSVDRPRAYEVKAESVAKDALKDRARQVGHHLLDQAAKDPERFLQGLERAAEGVEKLYRFFQTDPAQAKRVIRAAAIAAVAKAAKSKLEES